MSIGFGLLQKIMEENRPVSFLGDNDIPVEAFNPEETRVYEFMADHVLSHGRMPRVRTVEAELDVKIRGLPDEPIGYWVDTLKTRYLSAVILDGYEEVSKSVMDGEMTDAVDKLQSIAMSVGKRAAGDQITTLGASVAGVLEDHDIRQHSAMMKGIPFGIEYLDEVSDGAQPGDTIALVGRPGVGKSYIMGMIALHSYLYHEDVPLVVTMEMLTSQWARRTMALKSNITADMIRKGRLSTRGRDYLEVRTSDLPEMRERPYYLLQGQLGSTVEDLAMRIQELKPTVVYIDGAYLMQTRSRHRSRWERISEVAEFQKMIARDFNVPVIGSWQFNRKGPGDLGNIGFSDVIGQLASIVIAIKNDKNYQPEVSWRHRYYKIFDLLKGREGETGSIRVLYDMDRMIIEQDSVIEKEDEGGNRYGNQNVPA